MNWTTDQTVWGSRFAFVLWEVWKNINKMVFNDAWHDGRFMAQQAKKNSLEFMSLRNYQCVNMKATAIWVCWEPLKQDWFKLNTDEAFKRSTGLGSAGGLLRDNRGSWCWGFTINIGKVNSFIAELWGLREGLRLLRDRGCSKVEVELDSKAVVDIMTDAMRHVDDEDTLIVDCRYLSSSFFGIKYKHSLREGNTCADFLASMGQTVNCDTTVLEDPPEGILGLLEADIKGIGSRRIL